MSILRWYQLHTLNLILHLSYLRPKEAPTIYLPHVVNVQLAIDIRGIDIRGIDIRGLYTIYWGVYS